MSLDSPDERRLLQFRLYKNNEYETSDMANVCTFLPPATHTWVLGQLGKGGFCDCHLLLEKPHRGRDVLPAKSGYGCSSATKKHENIMETKDSCPR